MLDSVVPCPAQKAVSVWTPKDVWLHPWGTARVMAFSWGGFAHALYFFSDFPHIYFLQHSEISTPLSASHTQRYTAWTSGLSPEKKPSRPHNSFTLHSCKCSTMQKTHGLIPAGARSFWITALQFLDGWAWWAGSCRTVFPSSFSLKDCPEGHFNFYCYSFFISTCLQHMSFVFILQSKYMCIKHLDFFFSPLPLSCLPPASSASLALDIFCHCWDKISSAQS